MMNLASVLKDKMETLQTVANDAAGNVKFKLLLEFKKGQEGTNYTVEAIWWLDRLRFNGFESIVEVSWW